MSTIYFSFTLRILDTVHPLHLIAKIFISFDFKEKGDGVANYRKYKTRTRNTNNSMKFSRKQKHFQI